METKIVNLNMADWFPYSTLLPEPEYDEMFGMIHPPYCTYPRNGDWRNYNYDENGLTQQLTVYGADGAAVTIYQHTS